MNRMRRTSRLASWTNDVCTLRCAAPERGQCRLQRQRHAPAARIANAFVATPVAQFDEPWAMTFLPDGRLLVTEKKGALKLLNVESKHVGDIAGVPTVAYGGQGGFGDVILHPQFAQQLHRVREFRGARATAARAAPRWRAPSSRSTRAAAASSRSST